MATRIDNIKQMWPMINHKSKFMLSVAEELNKSPKTLRVYWFSNYGGWSVPDEHQEKVIELMQNWIQNQNQATVVG